MDDTLLAAHICRARRLAADHRFQRAAELLNTEEFWDAVDARPLADLMSIQSDLAWWLAWSGHTRRSLEILEDLAARVSGLDATGLTVLSRRAYVVGMFLSPSEAARAFAQLSDTIRDSDDVSPAAALHIRRQAARWRGTAGQPDQAVGMLLDLEREFASISDTAPREWLLLQSNIAYFMSQSDSVDLDDCLHRYNVLVEGRESRLGTLHPDTLDARRNRAWLLGRVDPVRALMQLTHLLSEAQTVLEPHHRYVVVTRLDLTVMLTRVCAQDPGFQAEGRRLISEHLIALSESVRSAESPQEVLAEYGRTDLSRRKVAQILESSVVVEDPGSTALAQQLHEALA